MLVPKSWWVIALKVRGKQHNGKSSEVTGWNRMWLQNMWRESTGCSRAWKKTLRWEKDGKEDAAMALSITLRKVWSGHCTGQPFQFIYILSLLTPLHLVPVHAKTCIQFVPKVDAMNTRNFCTISTERLHRDRKYLLTHHLLAPVALTLAKLLLIYICVEVSPMCSRKYSAQLGWFRKMK